MIEVADWTKDWHIYWTAQALYRLIHADHIKAVRKRVRIPDEFVRPVTRPPLVLDENGGEAWQEVAP